MPNLLADERRSNHQLKCVLMLFLCPPFIFVSSLACILAISNGGTVFKSPGSSGFQPADPLTSCESYISGGPTTAILESISALRVSNPTDIEAQWFLQPQMAKNTDAMVMQLAMLGGNQVALSGTCFLINPAQITYTHQVNCGPGTAVARQQCNPAKVADISGDGIVDIVDVILTLDVFGECSSGNWKCHLSDFDCNDKVDLFDVMYLLQRWGERSA